MMQVEIQVQVRLLLLMLLNLLGDARVQPRRRLLLLLGIRRNAAALSGLGCSADVERRTRGRKTAYSVGLVGRGGRRRRRRWPVLAQRGLQNLLLLLLGILGTPGRPTADVGARVQQGNRAVRIDMLLF